MIARDFLSQNIPPLKPTDTVQKAWQWMHDFHITHLPVVEDGRLLGVISEEDILNLSEPEATLATRSLSLRKSFVYEKDHIYEVVKAAVSFQLSIIPVIDREENFVGTITLEGLLKHFGEVASMTEAGSILVLEVKKSDYSLATIARIAESENIHVLSSYITSRANLPTAEVTLKLDSNTIAALVSTYERFGYVVKASYAESDYLETLQNRYDQLIHFLNI